MSSFVLVKFFPNSYLPNNLSDQSFLYEIKILMKIQTTRQKSPIYLSTQVGKFRKSTASVILFDKTSIELLTSKQV